MYSMRFSHLRNGAKVLHDAALDTHGTSCGASRYVGVVALFSCSGVGPVDGMRLPGLLMSYGSHKLPAATFLK